METKPEKGQARIQQLMEMFPELPREAVLAADYNREGLRRTAVLDDVGRWSWPDSHDHYEYDYEDHPEGDLIDGVSRTPKGLYYGKGMILQVMLDSHSPYEVKYEGGGRYWLYRDSEPVEEVYFIATPQWFWKKTSRGRSMNLIANSNMAHTEHGFSLYVSAYCEYFKDDNQCRFCNLNTTVDHFRELRQDRVAAKRQQDVYETYLACAQETPIHNITLLGGSFYDRSKEADLYIRNMKTLKRAIRDCRQPCEAIHIVSQAMEPEDQLRMKEAGATSVCWNLEVWDPELFKAICPGKSQSVGRERWIELLLKGVEDYGWGKVFTNFVVGAEMAPPYGNRTEDQEAESIIEGMQFMASHGVSLVLTTCRSNPGSHLARVGRPRTEHFLRLQQEKARISKEHGLVADPLARRLGAARSPAGHQENR